MDKIQEILAKMKAMSDAADFNPEADEYKGLEKDLARAKAVKIAKDAVEAETKALAKSVADNKPALNNLPPEVPVPARGDTGLVAETAIQKERSKLGMIEKYIVAGMPALSGVEAKTVAVPRQDKEHLAGGDVLIPQIMKDKIFRNVAKAWPSDAIASQDSTGYATDSGARNLFPPVQYVPELIKEPLRTSALPSLVRRIPAALGYVMFPKLDQSAGNWGGVTVTRGANTSAVERTAPTQTEAAFTDWTATTFRMGLTALLTNTTIRRTTAGGMNIESILSELFMSRATNQIGKEILHGLVASYQCEGIVGNTNVATVNRQKAGEVSWKDLVNLKFGIKQMFRAAGRYILCDGAEQAFNGLQDKIDHPLFNESMSPGLGMIDTLNKKPFHTENFVVADSTEATARGLAIDTALLNLGDAGDVLFGDPYYYGLGIEQDIALARSDQQYFTQDTVAFRLIAWVGGGLMVNGAFDKLGTAQAA